MNGRRVEMSKVTVKAYANGPNIVGQQHPTMTQFIWSVFVTTMGRNATDEVRCFAASAVNTARSRNICL